MFSFGTFPRWIKALSIILCIQLVSFPILLQAAENNSIPPQEQSYEQICAIGGAAGTIRQERSAVFTSSLRRSVQRRVLGK